MKSKSKLSQLVPFPHSRGGGGWGSPYSGLNGKALLEMVTFLNLAVYLKVGKIVILVYERVTKSAAKWKRWRLKLSLQKGVKFWQR